MKAPTKAGVALVLLMPVLATSQQRYRVYDTGVNEDPTRISESGKMVSSGHPNYMWDRLNGLTTIHGYKYDNDVYVQDVNSSGTAVGSAWKPVAWKDNTYQLVEFTWTPDVGIRRFGDFPFGSEACGINDLGEVVGDVSDVQGGSHAFRSWPDGGWEMLPPLIPDGYSGAWKVNAKGQIFGGAEFRKDVYDWHGVVWQPDGTIVDMGNDGPQYQNFPGDINTLGECVGGTFGPLGDLGFLWRPHEGYTRIVNPFKADAFIDATGINDFGLIVGTLDIYGVDYGFHAYIRHRNGDIVLLDDLLDSDSAGWKISEAFDINNHGEISAVGYFNGQRRGIMLRPSLRPVIDTTGG